MKKLLLLTILLFGINSFGQEIKVGQRFILKAPTKHSKTDLSKENIYDTVTKNPNYLGSRVKYKIVEIVNDSIIKVIADPPFNELKKGSKKISKATYYNYKLFNISKADFLTKAEDASQYDLPDRFNIGILTLPFKFRNQGDKSFESEFNLNSTLALRLKSIGGGHLFAQAGAGIGGVELNDVNAKGITDKATIKANALSMLVGLMIQYKKVQAGIYFGTDFINNQTFYQWNYQGKPWFAFGVGYQLFNVGLGQDDKNKEN